MVTYNDINDMNLLNDALEASGMAWWLIEFPSGLIFYDKNKVKMLGYSEKDSEKFVHFSEFGKLIHPDDTPRAMKAMNDYMEGKTETYQLNYRMKAKNGTYKNFFDRGKVVSKGDKGEVTVAGFVMDLTNTNLMPAGA
jgi:PAS domain S-box-containing protein